jgi:hypothetical protein
MCKLQKLEGLDAKVTQKTEKERQNLVVPYMLIVINYKILNCNEMTCEKV